MVWFRSANTMLPRKCCINDQSVRVQRYIVVILIFLVALPLLAQTVADDRALDTYLAWEKSQPPSSSWDQDDLLAHYAAHLKAIGVDPDTIPHLLASLSRRLDSEEAAFWDKIYSQPIPGYDPLPNKLLVRAVKGVKPGKALDVGMGQGRNAVFLAQHGWDVSGFDISKKALDLAQQHAKEAGVTIRTVLGKDKNFGFGEEQWDLIALLYPMEKRSFAKARDALKPGGLILVEGFHQDVHGPAVKYASNELLDRFSGFIILYYEDAIDVADWGKQEVRLVKLIAQKPAQP
jgi:SAM-dependent methyltransferase